MDMLDSCLAVTGRTYPPGYGFALVYLSDNIGPDGLKALQAAAWGAVERQARLGNPDSPAFVAAYGESKNRLDGYAGDWRYWAIEAAQLVIADAMGGNRKAGQALALCGHPGYELAHD